MTKFNQQSGQTLLIIIFAITLGLVALVGVSTRIVNSTRRVFIDNAYYKAQAVAEAGAEKFLQKSNAQLDAFLPSCGPSALYTAQGFVNPLPPTCVTLGSEVSFGESRAVVAVETFPPTSTYETESPANSVVSIKLIAGVTNLKVCWQGMDSLGSAYAEILSFYYSKDGSVYKLTQQKHECKGSLSWCSSPPAGYSASDGVEDTDVDGDYSCFDVLMTDTPQLINLMSLGNGSSYKITFTGVVPVQGYKITSVGEVKSGATATAGSLTGSSATRKKVVVEKSNTPNLGPWFNFAIASESGKIVAE